MAEINWKTKCWVTVMYLVHNDKVLLTFNKRLQTWIPIGGHIEPGESPEEAIKREVKEESGYEFLFFPEPIQENVRILFPKRIQLEHIPNHSEHINIIWYGKITKLTDAQETDEKEKLRWFTKEEILAEKEKMLENVWKCSLDALKIVK